MASITGVPVITTKESGVVVSYASRAYNFIGATVTEGPAGQMNVTVGGGGVFANQNLSNLLAPVEPNQDFDFGGTFFLKNLPNPVDPQDAATKDYVDNAVVGGNWTTAGNALTGGEVFGSTNAQDVVMIYGGTEYMRFFSDGLSLSQGAFQFLYATQSFRFGVETGGGNIQAGFTAGLAFGTAGAASSISAQSEALAFGRVANGGQIVTAPVSMAYGRADGANALIQSGNVGCAAFGDVGANSTVQSNTASVAFGQAVVGAGNGIVCNGSGSIAFGVVRNSSLISVVSGNGSAAFGFADGGFSLTVNGDGSIAGGSTATGSVAANAPGAIVWGDAVTTSAQFSQTFGIGHVNSSYAALVIGRYADANGFNANAAVDTDPAFLIGGGTNVTPKNIFRVDKDGKQILTASERNSAIRLVAAAGSISTRTDRTIVYDSAGAGGILTIDAAQDGDLLTFTPKGGGAAAYTLASANGALFDPAVTTALTSPVVQSIRYLNGVWYSV